VPKIAATPACTVQKTSVARVWWRYFIGIVDLHLRLDHTPDDPRPFTFGNHIAKAGPRRSRRGPTPPVKPPAVWGSWNNGPAAPGVGAFFDIGLEKDGRLHAAASEGFALGISRKPHLLRFQHLEGCPADLQRYCPLGQSRLIGHGMCVDAGENA